MPSPSSSPSSSSPPPLPRSTALSSPRMMGETLLSSAVASVSFLRCRSSRCDLTANLCALGLNSQLEEEGAGGKGADAASVLMAH